MLCGVRERLQLTLKYTLHDVRAQPLCSPPLQLCVAVRVYSWEAGRSVAMELRHGPAVSRHPGPQSLQRQQGAEQNGEPVDTPCSSHV